jgi:GNAT superfamily N-acetyltransferase
MTLPNGYSDVAPGQLAAVVTYLEMISQVPQRPERTTPPWRLEHIQTPDPAWYRELFARIGTEWLWFSRLTMPIKDLQEILSDPLVEVYAVTINGYAEGLLELDFRTANQCELAFFGLTPALLGQGAGRWLMNRALELAWARPINRLWVHTCTHDHPEALAFYRRSGFVAYAFSVEVSQDPRLTGLAPRAAAAHVPLIEKKI